VHTNRSSGRLAADVVEAWAIFRAALRIRFEPTAYCRKVADGVVRYLMARGVELNGRRVLDAGTGAGCIPEALRSAGAMVVGMDLRDHRLREIGRTPFVAGRGEALPFADGAFDVVVSSNVLEHVPGTTATIDELARVCRIGGYVYLSWTNWLSPLGGHEMSPFHYLGPTAALRIYRALRGRLPANMPGRSLFVVHVGSVLRELRNSALAVRDVAPRYWPSLRFLGHVPGLREVALWNCVILLEKRPITRKQGGLA
jgi:SAM-dependent methyltransferase